MSILRDVIARFQVQVDTKPLSDLDKKLNKARTQVNSMGKYVAAGFAAAAYGIYEFTEAASHADEMLNVIQASFKGSTDKILDWSKTMGKELGRSEYALQDFAGQWGSILDPMFKGTDKDITAMAEQLTALSVDLGSFYNTSDEEAMMRLKSGMMGETESVRKLGIDISDAALRERHEKSGAPGQYKSLSTADKTWLRFQKILEDTTNAQGDSARTAMGWANSLKRLQGKWQTFTVETGKNFKKILLPLVHQFETWVPKLEALIKDTSALETAFHLAVITTGVLVTAFLALNAPLVLTTSLMLLTIGLFEDFNTFLDGGTSVIGDFIKIVTDVSNPLELWNRSMNTIVGYIDILGANLFDLAVNIARVVTGEAVRSGFTTEAGDAARGRAAQAEKNRAGVAAGLEKQRQDAAASGDWDAFKATYKGETMTSDELTGKALEYRKQSLTKGAVANQDDVASGLVSNNWLAKQAKDTYGPMTADQATAMNAVKEEQVKQVTFNMYGDISGQPKEVQEKLDKMARDVVAAMKEER